MGAGRCFGGLEESSKAGLLFWSRGCGSRDVYLWQGHPAFEPTKRRTAQLFYLSVHGSEWPGGERTNDAFCVSRSVATRLYRRWELCRPGAAGRRSNGSSVIHWRQGKGYCVARSVSAAYVEDIGPQTGDFHVEPEKPLSGFCLRSRVPVADRFV